MTGAEISTGIKNYLRAVGARVWVFNAPGRVYVRNFVDVLAVWRGMTFFIECKGDGDRLRSGQRELKVEMEERYTGPFTHYLLARHPDDILPLIETDRPRCRRCGKEM